MENTNMDQDALNLAKAIRQKESGGNFNAVGDNGTSRGAFQFQEGTWKSYAKEILGDENAPLTEDNEKAVAYGKIKQLKDQGKTPAQIAAIWNSGSDQNWENKIGYNSRIGVNYNVPQYVKDVTDIYHKNKSQYPNVNYTGVNSAPIEQQREQMQASGQPLPVNPEKTKTSFLGDVVRGIAKVPVKLGLAIARGTGIGNALTGEDAYSKGLTLNSRYLGDVSDPLLAVEKKAVNLADKVNKGEISLDRAKLGALGAAASEGLDLATLVPFGSAASSTAKAVGQEAVEQGGKTLLQGAKAFGKSALEGAGLGAGFETSRQLETGEQIKPIKIAESVAIGGALQPAAELGLPGLVKGIKKVSPTVKAATEVISGNTSPETKKFAQNFIDKEVDRVAQSLPLSYRQNQENILKATGSNGFNVWKEHGLLPEQVGKNYNTDNIREALKPYIEKGAEVTQKFAKNETALFNVDESLNAVLESIDKTAVGNAQKEKMAQTIVSFINQNISPVIEKDGGRLIDAEQLVNLKRALYNSAGFSDSPVTNTKAQKILESPFYDLARELTENVNKNATLKNFKLANKTFSDYLSADTLAKQLNGRVAKSTEGLTGKLMRRAIFTGGGAGIGSLPGAFIGNLVGESLDRFYTDPSFRTSLFRKALGESKEPLISQLGRRLDENIKKRGVTKLKVYKESKSLLDRFKYQGQPKELTNEEILNAIKTNPNALKAKDGSVMFNGK